MLFDLFYFCIPTRAMPPLPATILTVPVWRVVIDTTPAKYHTLVRIIVEVWHAVQNLLHIL